MISKVYIYLLLGVALFLTVQSQPKILRTPTNSPDVPPCALTCVGGGPTVWKMSRYYRGRAYTTTDISKCGFVGTPVVSANIVGRNLFPLPPTVALNQVTKEKFGAFVLGADANAQDVNKRALKLHWTAHGYVTFVDVE